MLNTSGYEMKGNPHGSSAPAESQAASNRIFEPVSAAAAPAPSPAVAAVNAARRDPTPHEVIFVSYSSAIYMWPLVVIGFLNWSLFGMGVSPEVLGWSYIGVLVLVLTTYAFDLNRNKAAFLVVSLSALGLLGAYLKDVHHITIIGNIYRWFDDLDVSYNAPLGIALSIFTGIPLLVSIGYSQINDRWRFTHNELEHHSFGRSDESVGRGSKMIRIEYPDVLEFLLAFSGTIVIFDSTGEHELRRIPNVVCMPFRKRKLDKILERKEITAITMA